MPAICCSSGTTVVILVKILVGLILCFYVQKGEYWYELDRYRSARV